MLMACDSMLLLVRSIPSTDPSVRTLRSALCDVLTILTATCNWPAEHIFLMGFSQGACVAVDGALTWCQEKKRLAKAYIMIASACVTWHVMSCHEMSADVM